MAVSYRLQKSVAAVEVFSHRPRLRADFQEVFYRLLVEEVSYQPPKVAVFDPLRPVEAFGHPLMGVVFCHPQTGAASSRLVKVAVFSHPQMKKI